MKKPPEEQTSGPVAVYQPPEPLMIATGTGRPLTHTFDPKTPAGAKMLLDATLKELPDLFAMGGKTISVAHIFQHDAMKIDDTTGGESHFRRTVVWDESGNAWACGSQGVDKALQVIAAMIGQPPWNPPIPCEVQVTRTKKGRNWMILYPDMAAIAKMFNANQRKK